MNDEKESTEKDSAERKSETEALKVKAAAAYEKLDRKEYPELARRLALFTGNDADYAADEDFSDDYDYCDNTPYNAAHEIMLCDCPKPLPDFIIAFVTELMESEIRKGNDQAMNSLGAMHYDGSRGFPQSFDKAVHYYTMAARQGNSYAQENLGYCYYYGRIGEPDYEKAFQFFALGAFKGQLISLYKIGDMYFHGYYVEQNLEEAFSIYQRCREGFKEHTEKRISGPVYLRLAQMCLAGQGTEQDPALALRYFHKAEEHLFTVVKEGDVMYRKSLEQAISGAAEARELLRKKLPGDTWDFN